jgi:excisionase family DNA binding protein
MAPALQQNNLVPALYSVAQAAVILNVSEKTIRRLLERGILRSSRATRKKLIPVRDLETFFERTQ